MRYTDIIVIQTDEKISNKKAPVKVLYLVSFSSSIIIAMGNNKIVNNITCFFPPVAVVRLLL